MEDLRMIKKLPHPGSIVKRDFLEPCGLTVTETAKRLGVNRQTLSNIINGRSGISPEMAIRLSKGFGGKTAEEWLKLQMDYDLAKAMENEPQIKVRRIVTLVDGDYV
jgi:addiction module HigA family antidote